MAILQLRETDEAVIAKPKVIKFDLPESDRLREELAALTADGDELPLLIDLSVVEFIPSATLGVLVEVANRCRQAGRPLALIRLAPKVRDVFRICSLDSVFAIHADETEALAAI
jgi:anti-anti-sigma factor